MTIEKKIRDILGEEGENLLTFSSPKVSKEALHLPGPNWVERIFSPSNRNIRTLQNLQTLFNSGRLAGTGYLSILPVDQGVEHSAGASFAPHMPYFDPENMMELAIEGGVSGIATTLGGLSLLARKYAHKIPLILKLNHNELLSYPNTYDQIFFASVEQAYSMGCRAVGATIYFGSQESPRQIAEVSKAFALAHEKGMATILWCYLRNSAFTSSGVDYHTAADLTGQANHLGVTIGADIIKQKLPTLNGGFAALQFGKSSPQMIEELSSPNPIDLTRYQILNNYMGRIGLINSGGASLQTKGAQGRSRGECSEDLRSAVRSALINKRAGGMGLICGRKAFQKPLKEGLEVLEAIQDVYLSSRITIA